MTADSPYLFVYGTLRCGAGVPEAQFFSAETLVGMGTCRGRIFELDGYPGMIPSSVESDEVVGEVHCLNDPSRDWPLLDKYEGCGPADPTPREFERRIVSIQMKDGRTLDAWAYLYCLDISNRIQILSGDYFESYRQVR
jgi:gamma-glutamylcyclotransferase (GGCT)/AIG2-like uncharacterized protein YtfP